MINDKKAPSLRLAISNASQLRSLDVSNFIEFDVFDKEGEKLLFAAGNEKHKKRITSFTQRLVKSAEGAKLVKAVNEAGYKIEMVSGLDRMLGLCDPEEKTICLNDGLSNSNCVEVLAHEMKHALQFERNVTALADKHNIKSQIMITRAMEADAEATAALVTWELKAKGDNAPWDEFEKESFGISRAFKAVAGSSNLANKPNKNKALTAAFRAWYDNKNIMNAYDENFVEYMEDYEKQGFLGIMSFDKDVKPKKIIDGICSMSDGEKYFDAKPDLLEKEKYLSVSPDVMEDLEDLMARRKENYGIEPDKSLEKIHIYESDTKRDRKGHVKKSLVKTTMSKKETVNKRLVRMVLSEKLKSVK
jgi:hypothetical protein